MSIRKDTIRYLTHGSFEKHTHDLEPLFFCTAHHKTAFLTRNPLKDPVFFILKQKNSPQNHYK